MRNFVIILLLGFSTYAQAQQFKSATLYLSDGTVLRGDMKYSLSNDQIKYREVRGKKVRSISKSDVVKFDIQVSTQKTTYFFKDVKKSSIGIQHLKPVIEGKLSLFRFDTEDFISDYDTTIGRAKIDYLYKIGGKPNNQYKSRNFKKFASSYFEDCPQLIAKINNKEFKRKDIIQIVEYYNTNCN